MFVRDRIFVNCNYAALNFLSILLAYDILCT